MICGHCKDKHATVAEVRLCSQVKIAPKVEPITEAGMYRRGSDVFQVVWNSNQTRLYAKRYVPTYAGDGKLHRIDFVYDKGAIFTLSACDRMTVDEVAQLGKKTGRCWVCRHKLTVQKSIAAGIGPVCAKKV